MKSIKKTNGRKRKCSPKQMHRIVQDDDGHWYIIKADELQIFNHWEEAMNGRRHMPADFSPVQIDCPQALRFCEWTEVSE